MRIWIPREEVPDALEGAVNMIASQFEVAYGNAEAGIAYCTHKEQPQADPQKAVWTCRHGRERLWVTSILVDSEDLDQVIGTEPIPDANENSTG